MKEVVKAARDHGCSMRIGVNAGSLEKHLLEKYGEPNPEALVESALYHANILQQHDFHDFKISVKASDVFLAVAAYQQLAEVCDHPLHIGITEAGGRRMGTVKSAIGLGSLLWAGIGDTLRVSLSDEPEEEVRVGWDMLKTLGIRHRGVKVISCPSCARQGFNVIETVRTLEDRLAHIETPLTLSIIGCVVNGPGEALMTDIGLTGGGNGRHMIYAAGKTDHTIDGARDGGPHRRTGGGEGGGAEGREGRGEAGGGVNGRSRRAAGRQRAGDCGRPVARGARAASANRRACRCAMQRHQTLTPPLSATPVNPGRDRYGTGSPDQS